MILQKGKNVAVKAVEGEKANIAESRLVHVSKDLDIDRI